LNPQFLSPGIPGVCAAGDISSTSRVMERAGTATRDMHFPSGETFGDRR
jgi:hypothetical protein